MKKLLRRWLEIDKLNDRVCGIANELYPPAGDTHIARLRKHLNLTAEAVLKHREDIDELKERFDIHVRPPQGEALKTTEGRKD